MEKKGSFDQELDSNDSLQRGFNSYDLRPTTLKRETPGFLSFDPVYRSLSDLDDLRPTSLSRSSFRESDLSRPLNRSFDSDLSRPTYRALIEDSVPSSSNVFPSSDVISSKKSSTSFVPRVPYDIQLQSSALSRKDIPIEPPPVPGGYLEPNCHLISRSKPTSLFDLIPQTLQSLLQQRHICYGIDMDANQQKFKVKCVAYPLGELKLQFICRVFRMDPDEQGKRYALEFQRRSGCALQFADLWTKCKRSFQDSGLFITEKNVPQSKPLGNIATQTTDAEIRQTLRCLLQMAASKCCDVKSQAIAALCKMSAEEQQKAVMIEEEGCVEAFIAAAGCPDEDVHRSAISVLANLAHKRADVCKKFADKNGVERLCTLSNSNTKEIVRESLRALSLLAESLGSRILDDGCHRVLENHRNSPDLFTRQTVQYLTKLAA